MKKVLERKQYMSQAQLRTWKAAEEKEGGKIPRTHENCQRILGKTVKVPVRDDKGNKVKGKFETRFIPGPARPGKTAKDRANKGR